MQTAEEFVRDFLRNALTHQRAVALIEADRADAKLAVLTELEELGGITTGWAYKRLRAKYAAVLSGGKENG